MNDHPPELGTAEPIRLDVSIGIACYPESGGNAAAITEAAAQALDQANRAKSSGPDRIQFADPVAP